MPVNHRSDLVARACGRRAVKGWLGYGHQRYPCAFGSAGVTHRKREGDGATPAGRWRIERVFYRPDRDHLPLGAVAAVPMTPLRPHDGWCDATGDRNYNRYVPMPYDASAERLWRADEIYDVIVVLSHNRRPRVQGTGSAIFMHIARPAMLNETGPSETSNLPAPSARLAPTQGCIALARGDLVRLLQRLRPGAALCVI